MASLFGTSGIRGVANSYLTPKLILEVGQALATYSQANEILTARDTRTTSYMLQCALAAGISSCGATVLDQNVIPTPALAYLTKKLNADAGSMITASHNPPEYNGVKLFNPDTTAYSHEQQCEVEKVLEKRRIKLADWRDVGKTVSVNESAQYEEMILNSVELHQLFKVIVDPGNGATSHIAPRLLRKMNCEVKTINSHMDGFFPGRGAEPTAESLQPICSLVRSMQLDLGIAYDGDGDRMVVIDERGLMAPFDQIFAAYAAYVIRKNKKKIVVTHIEASMIIETMVEAEGGKVVRTQVGDVNIAAEIKRQDAAFGGEPCGAWIHPKQHYCPDGILSSILVLKMLEDEGLKASELLSQIPQYPILREDVSCPYEKRTGILKKIIESLVSTFPNAQARRDGDSYRMTTSDGWLLVRLSGTEPVIRITAEAETKRATSDLMKQAKTIVNRFVKKART